MELIRTDRGSGPGSPHGTSFKEVWPQIEPLVHAIFTHKNLSKSEWQEIFWKVHLTCMWDPKSAIMFQRKLRDLFDSYVLGEQKLIFAVTDNNQVMMRAYMFCWKRFMFYYTYFPLPFAPLEKLVFNRGGAIGESFKRKSEETENFIRLSMMEIWVLHIFSKISDRLISGAMMLVEAERKNESSDPSLIVGVKDSCVALCQYLPNPTYIYRNNFEGVYLASIVSHYEPRCQDYYDQHGILAYLTWVDSKIKEEIDRAARYLEPQSLGKVVATCDKTMVAKYKDLFAEKFLDLIKINDIESLNMMFLLLDRVDDGINFLLVKFKKYIIDVGSEDLRRQAHTIVQDSEKYIGHLLNLYQMATNLIQIAFNRDARFMTTRDISLSYLINNKSILAIAFSPKQDSNQSENTVQGSESEAKSTKNPATNTVSNSYDGTVEDNYSAINPAVANNSSDSNKRTFDSRNAELFANYCDIFLRKTNISRHLSAEQIETKLKNVIILLKYLQEKDIFMKFYKAHLTRRLILDVSADLDKEEIMVTWLREIGMPADYVNKISRMFQDLKVSEDFNAQFRSQYHDKQSCDLITVKILNSSTWTRSFEKVNITLPSEIEELIPKIESFYMGKHNGRNLFWHQQFSYGTITYNSDNGSYDLELTSYQATVMFCWNDRPNDSLSLETLSLSTQLPNIELRKTLWSLISNPKLKTQLLLVEPSPSSKTIKSFKDFSDDTKFKLNLKFAMFGKTGRILKRGRFNLIGRLQLQPEKFREEEAENIMKLRTLRSQEAIIKIMKMRKTIHFNQLCMELTHMLKDIFVPSKSLIKDQLEWLIENEYIQRDINDNNILNYC